VSFLLLSTYDLGRQPFGVASPAAWLRDAGLEVIARDLSRDRLADEDITRAAAVAVYLPMHTATRLALPVLERIRSRRPEVPIAAYGLYAPLNEELLRAHGVSAILGPEAEAELVAFAVSRGGSTPPGRERSSPERPVPSADGITAAPPSRSIPRLAFKVPDRTGLPALERYAALQLPDGTRRVAGATEATRGCKHRCRHCPIVPVYDGQFRVVPVDVVLADIDQQVAAGATHITFGDPDFLNGPAHARRVIEALHARHPHVTYDVTIKIEHLLAHRSLLPVLASTGCLFITSAVEAVDDRVLRLLQKGHTRADFVEAVALTRAAGIALAPTFVAFTPWTTVEGYRELLDVVEELDLIDHVAPVQWGLRLLVTSGSRLLELDDIAARVQRFDPKTLTYPWRHDDPAVDALQQAIAHFIGVRASRTRREVFEGVSALCGRTVRTTPRVARAAIPYLDEPWYC
jgi:radical SAM superfamily enzyme YgiQ (UPF0313 family)